MPDECYALSGTSPDNHWQHRKKHSKRQSEQYRCHSRDAGISVEKKLPHQAQRQRIAAGDEERERHVVEGDQ
jgi:hypothetical protein